MASKTKQAEQAAQVGSVAWVLHDDSPLGYSLLAAIKESDGKAALSAFDAIINDVGGEGTGNVYLWVKKQKIVK